MALSESTISSARIPHGKNQLKISDGGGLYLLINTSGRYWKLAYRFDGKQKSLSLGVYPAVGLEEARERRDEAKRLLANNIDPGYVRQQKRHAQRMMNAEAMQESEETDEVEDDEVVTDSDHEKHQIVWAPASVDRSELHRLEDRRLRILLQLASANGYMTNEHLLQLGLDTTGHKVSFDRLRTDLAWLSEQQVIHLDTSDVWVATLTRSGLDCANGRLWVPAIRRPDPVA